MRMQKPILILLAVLAFSVITQGQSEFAKRELDDALDNLRTASQGNQDPGPKADLQKAVITFLDSAEVKKKDFTSGAFNSKVENLKRQAEAVGREGPLVKAVKSLDEKNVEYKTSTEDSGSPTPPPNTKLKETSPPPDDGEGFIASLSPFILPLVQGLVVLSALALLLYSVIALQRLRRTTDEFNGALPKALSAVKGRQDELAKKIDASAALNKEMSSSLTDVQSEVRLMSRMLQQANLANNRPANPSTSYMETPAAPASDMPVFPIAADELLRQMHNKAVVVKRDFQNDMLVSDPDGKGELVLIRDSQLADEAQPLFIIPSVTQFQMRQEYYNFYEKYYDCSRPESGAVWIIDPAVVEKVSGGWQLRERGILEVR